jgi:hypothetical protein
LNDAAVYAVVLQVNQICHVTESHVLTYMYNIHILER